MQTRSFVALSAAVVFLSAGSGEAAVAPERQLFDDGRYAIAVPAKLAFVSDKGKSGFTHLSKAGDATLLIHYEVSARPDPTATTDLALHRYAIKGQLAAAKGRETGRQTQQMKRAGLPATVVSFVSGEAEGKPLFHQLAVFAADAQATFMVEVTQSVAPAAAASFTAMLDSFEVLKPRVAEAPKEPEFAGRDAFQEAPAATPAEVKAAPRSTKLGQKGLANSCNLISVLGQCFETASTAVGQGFYSNADMCTAGRFGTEPCPGARRTGGCVLPGGQQVGHLYEPKEGKADLAAQKKMCESTWTGRWESAPKRPWPTNGKGS
jgi:hypothetical protein